MMKRRVAVTDVVRRSMLAAGCCLLAGTTAVLAQAADSVTVDAARAASSQGKAVLIDIREPDEHAGGVAPWARRLPMSQLPERLAEIPRDPGTPVLLICRTQNRSGRVAQLLREQGYTNVRFVEGGMTAWQERRFETVAPR